MHKFFSIIKVLIVSLMLTSTCAAEDFQFVDADGFTGYYVDMDSVDNVSRSIIAARVAVIKADLNRMFIYDVRFNHAAHEYQLVASQTIEYNTKNVLESKNVQQDFRAYSPNSEMSELIRFIMYGGDLP